MLVPPGTSQTPLFFLEEEMASMAAAETQGSMLERRFRFADN
jgi:hypothetical protein